LDGMVAVLDYRDTETQWHSRRVSRFTRRIAEQLGIRDAYELRTIEMGALLHDIGKIGVRDAVLLKPGPLDQEEWHEMREHPQGVLAFCAIEEQEWLQIRSEVEKISLVEQEWGWTPPKRIFEQIREAATKQKQPISQPPDGADAKVG